jgi:hypothetical protein
MIFSFNAPWLMTGCRAIHRIHGVYYWKLLGIIPVAFALRVAAKARARARVCDDAGFVVDVGWPLKRLLIHNAFAETYWEGI